jgi:aspartate aminotransferase-like enzyme
LLLGSGTLGNDVVAAQLKLLPGRGVVLSNGEFGDRLIDHAQRMGLDFEILRCKWGEPYDLLAIESFLRENPHRAWLWSVHCETSTGILNDQAGLAAACSRQQLRLCLDCTSSLGTVAVDLRGVYLASSVSGKGLASFPGLSMVFSNHQVVADRRLPRYLDLGYYRQNEGVPFTQSSNLVTALRQALLDLQPEERFAALRQLSARLCGQLEALGFELLGAEQDCSPAVLSIVLPESVSSERIGTEMESRGWLLSFRSGYLLERNIIQICLMGTVTEEQCLQMVQAFAEVAAGGYQVPGNQRVC